MSGENIGVNVKENMTLEDAFKVEMDGGDRNDERAVRAASFLLDWASDEDAGVDRFLAVGISRVLDVAASNMARTRRRIAKEQERALIGK